MATRNLQIELEDHRLAALAIADRVGVEYDDTTGEVNGDETLINGFLMELQMVGVRASRN